MPVNPFPDCDHHRLRAVVDGELAHRAREVFFTVCSAISSV